MRKLTIIRHAKSSWKDFGASDFDRKLNKRGRKDAPAMGAYMASSSINPDLILCSAALRTKETLELLKESAGFSSEIQILEQLYLIGKPQLIKLLSKSSDDYNHICVIAHNPGLHELVLSLTADASPEIQAEINRNFPTSAMAHFELAINHWSELPDKKGSIKLYMTPGLLPD